MSVAITILLAMLLMLFRSQPVRQFNVLKWIVIGLTFVLLAMCIGEAIRTF